MSDLDKIMEDIARKKKATPPLNKNETEEKKESTEDPFIENFDVVAQLISLNEGFRIIKEKNFSTKEYPMNKLIYLKDNIPRGLKNHHFIDSWTFNNFWITSLFFDDCVVIDCQKGNNGEKGHPDFIVIPKKLNDLKEIKYVEFKNEEDALRLSQMNWFAKNGNKDRYVLVVKKDDTEERLRETLGKGAMVI